METVLRQKPETAIACFAGIEEREDNPGPLEDGEYEPGTLLDGRFIIGKALSRGGMAILYKAEDTQRQNGTVVIKVPHFKCENDPANFARFQHEAKIGSRLNHPLLLKFIPIAGRKSRAYAVTEFVRGCTLAHLLKAMHPISESDALKIASLVCEALQYLHDQGFIHRDLKPANIMVGCDRTLRLLDFGLAAPISRTPSFLSHMLPLFGTPDYMAPEQVKKRRNDERTDLYSLGAILYEMLTGSVPFPPGKDAWANVHARVSGDPLAPRAVNPAISPQAEEIVLHALQRSPADRYRTAAAFKADLDHPEKVALTGYRDRLRPPRNRFSFESTQLLTGAAAGVGILVALAGLFLLLRHLLAR